MSINPPPTDPPPYAQDPPPYDEPEEDDANKTVQPTIHVLSGQSIHAESTDAAPLYQLTRGIAKLTYATSKVELSRVDRVVRTDVNGEPEIRQRARHIYDVRHLKARSLPSDTPVLFVEAQSRKALGSFGLTRRMFRSGWRALPVDTTGKSSKYNFPAFVKDAKPLFEARMKHDKCEWTDSEGNAIAVEDEGEGQHRLLVTACLHRDTVDALVALWCCRLWQHSAENEEPLSSGMDSSKPHYLGMLRLGVLLTCIVRKKLASASEVPKGGWYR